MTPVQNDQFVSVPVPSHLVTAVMRFIAERAAPAGDPSGSARDDPDTRPPAGGRDADDPLPRLTWREWRVEDFTLLAGDARPSTRRIITVLDVLAERPDVELSTTDLAAATGLTRGELRGAFSGFTRVCNSLRSDVRLDWPILWSYGPSTHDGQDQETFYHVPAAVAQRWKQAHAS